MRIENLDRRGLLRGAARLSASAALAGAGAPLIAQAGSSALPSAPPPITPAERLGRLARAQAAMRAAGMGAMLVEAGSSLAYLTGVQWWRSERLTAALIPAAGEVMIVTPAFEEPSIREMLAVPGDVRVWQEDESPSRLIVDWLTEHRLTGRPFGIEETVRFFAVDGVRTLAPRLDIRSAAAIVNGLRMIKSPAEIALMQHASDITVAAYRATGPQITAGMSGADIFAIMAKETADRGGATPSGGVQVGAGSALPHGSRVPERVARGSVILMDCGCTVDGYHSDISRTLVFGDADAGQRRMWEHVRRGQDVAMGAARIGVTAGSVDDAVRRFYEGLGYGPGYRLPGLSHRTGHGIGLDVHEPVNLVHGEETLLAPGMCFSNEPGLYQPGAYGVRLEDCFYMTEEGPRFFSQPPPDIERPFS